MLLKQFQATNVLTCLFYYYANKKLLFYIMNLLQKFKFEVGGFAFYHFLEIVNKII